MFTEYGKRGVGTGMSEGREIEYPHGRFKTTELDKTSAESVVIRTGSPIGTHRRRNAQGKVAEFEGSCPICDSEGGPGPSGTWSGCGTCGWCY